MLGLQYPATSSLGTARVARWTWKEVRGSGKSSPGVEKFEYEDTLTGGPIRDSPAMVAMPLPMCRAKSGRFALQGTTLRWRVFESAVASWAMLYFY